MRYISVISKIGLMLWLLNPMGAFAAGSSSTSESTSNYANTASTSYLMKQAQQQLSQQKYQRAFDLLKKEILLNPDNADGWNLLGFSARKMGDFETAQQAYNKALSLDPKHTQAMEYMGEMYLSLNQPDEAKKLLSKLDKLCSFNCKDRDMLKAAIEAYTQKNS